MPRANHDDQFRHRSGGIHSRGRAGFPNPVVTWSTWWLADAAGTLLIAPAFLLWEIMPLAGSSKWDVLKSIAVSALAGVIGIVAYSPLIGSDLISNDLNVDLPY